MSTTLAQAITDLGLKAGSFERPAGPVLDPLLAAVELVVSARARLSGLEEAQAITAAREHAFERALELKARVDPLDVDVKLLELADFLAPGFEELDGVRAPSDDPFGPTDSVSELEGKLTEAEETVLAQRDRIADLIAERDVANDELEAIRADSTVVVLWGEELGRMTNADADKASVIIQRELSSRSATAQRLEERLASSEAQRHALEADIAAITADKERALEVIRGHVETADTTKTTYETALEVIRTERDEALERAATWETRCRVLNPLFGGPRITEELPDLDTLNRFGVGLHGDRIAFVLIGQELEREDALVMAAHTVAIADRGEGLFAAIYRKVCNA